MLSSAREVSGVNQFQFILSGLSDRLVNLVSPASFSELSGEVRGGRGLAESPGLR